jgi:hypothetical protein
MDAITAFVAVFITTMVVGIPLLGLTLRLTVKPLLQAWTRLREAEPRSTTAELEGLKLRVAALEAVFEAPLTTLDQRPLHRLTEKS